jgi:hypothetical protein
MGGIISARRHYTHTDAAGAQWRIENAAMDTWQQRLSWHVYRDGVVITRGDYRPDLYTGKIANAAMSFSTLRDAKAWVADHCAQ